MVGSALTGTSRHVRRNRADWDGYSGEYQRKHASQLNRFDGGRWGTYGISEKKLNALGDLAGKDVLEFGCGAAQWSIVLARLGARPVGLDLSIRQLDHARALLRRADVRVPLVNASGEQLPFGDERFDLVFCDHGAMTFADPFATVPEAARVLRPGGSFVFNIESVFHFVCWNGEKEEADDRLHRDYFDVWRDEYEGGVTFNLPYGEWIRLFLANGLEVEDLIELRPSTRARSTYEEFVTPGWARRWPAENIWKTRKR